MGEPTNIGCIEAESRRLRELCDRLKMEAQSHAMEARGANDTIQKIYQIVTGARGEPGNWNAEVPVREEFERLRARIAELESGLNTIAQAGALYGGAWCVAQARGHLEGLDFDMWPETGKPPAKCDYPNCGCVFRGGKRECASPYAETA